MFEVQILRKFEVIFNANYKLGKQNFYILK